MNNSSLLVARNLRKVFVRKTAKPIEVLRNVNLEISPGDTIAIVGKSGAGKSTCLHLLGTLEEPTEGTVHFLGQNIFGFSESQLAVFRNRQLGFVFQFHYLMLEFSALENVMMPVLLSGESRKKAKERAEWLLSRVGLGDRADHKPNQLSGGEQQRVAIARALVMQPKLLLTDEMTGNLDPTTGHRVFELVQSIHEEFKMAMVSVTHDERLAANYGRQYRLVEGGLVEETL